MSGLEIFNFLVKASTAHCFASNFLQEKKFKKGCKMNEFIKEMIRTSAFPQDTPPTLGKTPKDQKVGG